jgi:hypothetical protein
MDNWLLARRDRLRAAGDTTVKRPSAPPSFAFATISRLSFATVPMVEHCRSVKR